MAGIHAGTGLSSAGRACIQGQSTRATAGQPSLRESRYDDAKGNVDGVRPTARNSVLSELSSWARCEAELSCGHLRRRSAKGTAIRHADGAGVLRGPLVLCGFRPEILDHLSSDFMFCK